MIVCYFSWANQTHLRAQQSSWEPLRLELWLFPTEPLPWRICRKRLKLSTLLASTSPQTWLSGKANSSMGYRRWFPRARHVNLNTNAVLPGQQLSSSTLKSLRWLVHTGFYSYPGTYKFRVILINNEILSKAWSTPPNISTDWLCQTRPMMLWWPVKWEVDQLTRSQSLNLKNDTSSSFPITPKTWSWLEIPNLFLDSVWVDIEIS